jgi:RHS repeat-associated protein
MFTASECESRFTGKERDSETGLDYFGARYYGSTMGRFLSPDEFAGGPVDVFGGEPTPPGPLPYADITIPQSLNKYSYTYNNPLRYTDPDGHDIWDTLLGVVNSTVNNFAGIQRIQGGNADFRAGQVIGDVASVVAGTVGAIGAAAGDVALDVGSGGAALLAAPAQAAAVVIPANGAINGAISLYRATTGGAYTLTDPNTGDVQRTGRTNDLDRREKEHARDPQTKELKFNVDKRTDNAAARRGREQIIHDKYKPPMNKINPVSPKNPDRAKYLREAKKLGD